MILVDYTSDDLLKSAAIAPTKPDLLTQIIDFITRADSLTRNMLQLLGQIQAAKNNPALVAALKGRAEKLGLSAGSTAAKKEIQAGGEQMEISKIDKQFEEMINALNQFKVMVGDLPLSQLIEWLQKNQETVKAGMRAKLGI